MSREGRLGFPRPFGQVLSQYRPLIPARFKNAPRPVASIATAFDDMREVRSVELRDVQGLWSTDIVLNIKGVDEFSKSSLVFTPEGRFEGGMLRAGSVVANTDREQKEILNRWRALLTEGVGLDFNKDDIETILREDPGFGDRSTTYTPHVFFTTRRPVMDDRTSPLDSSDIIKIVESVARDWDMRFSDMSFAARAGMTSEESGEMRTEGTLRDMLDRF